MLPEKIIYIGVLVNLFCSVWYIKTIFSDGTRPNIVSWFIWMIAPFVGVYLSLKAGAGLSVWGIFMSGFGPFLVIVFSLFKKNSFWKINLFDIVCGIFSLIALIVYVITHNIAISILFAIISDGLAALPTILKSWKFPQTESSLVYFGGVVNNTLALLIIKSWAFSIYSFSIYLLLINIIIILVINREKLRFQYFFKFLR